MRNPALEDHLRLVGDQNAPKNIACAARFDITRAGRLSIHTDRCGIRWEKEWLPVRVPVSERCGCGGTLSISSDERFVAKSRTQDHCE